MILIILMAIIDLIVLSLMKQQLVAYNPIYFLIAFIFYGCQPLIFYQSLKNGGGLCVNNVLWDISSDILVLIIAVIYFKEILSKYQLCGIFLAFISMYLLNI